MASLTRMARDLKSKCKSHQMSLLGVKRTCLFALHMSAFDPKRTQAHGRLKAYPPSFSMLV
jgi:hypothetical protein